jgi:two-component sensor histidine kinase
LDTPTATRPDAHPRSRAKRAAETWRRLSPARSLREGLLFMTVVAVTPLVLFASGMALLRARDTEQILTAAAWAGVAAVPVLIGVAAVVIVGIATEAMVLHWLNYLERLSRAYARGRYSLRPRRLLEAPYEFRTLGEAVEEMAAAVEHRDQALRESLEEQTVLLREVHHRVKNNLQIIGSLLSLQASRSTDIGVREALQDALTRIDAISLSQRFMQQQEEEERISSTELFDAFAIQVRARLGAGRRVLTLITDIEPGIMPLETGSRLVLAAAEAVLCAFRASDEGVVTCRLTVSFEDECVRLTLSTAGAPDAFTACPDRVSRDLIDGYVRQLRGRLRADAGSGELCIFAPLIAQLPPPPAVAHPASGAQGMKFFRVLDRTQGGLAS